MIRYEIITRPGDREINEDSVGRIEKDGVSLFAVADGLGGHGAGDVASAYATENLLRDFALRNGTAERFFPGAFAEIQSGLIDLQSRTHKDMKTTLCSVMISESKITVCHVGDSRAYLFSKRGVICRTQDHSVPQMLCNAGEIKEKQIRHHPDRNRLLRALGERTEFVQYDMFSVVRTDEIKGILLCTDGFWEHVNEKEMIKSLRRSSDPAEWLSRMERTLQKNGKKYKKDNYSAIGVLL